jgi:hypothetical protein
MKNLAYLTLLLFMSGTIAYSIDCNVFDSTGFYNLHHLADLGANKTDNHFNFTSKRGVKYYLGLCDEIKYENSSSGDRLQNRTNGNHSLIKVSEPVTIKHHSKLVNNLIEDDNGGYLTYSVKASKPHSKDQNSTYKLELTLRCDPTGDENAEPVFNHVTDDEEGGFTIKGELTHKQACAIFSIEEFYRKNRVAFAIGFIVGGLFIAFIGRKLFKVVFFLLGAVVVTAVVFLIFYQSWLIKMENRLNVNRNLWIALGISGFLGIVAGVLLVIYEKLCFFAAGGVLGGLGGFLLYTAIIANFLPAVLSFD